MLGGIFGFLAAYAQTYAGHGTSPRFRDGCLAFFTMGQPGAVAQLRTGALNGVVDGRVDLVLDGAVTCPTCGHDVSPMLFRNASIGPDARRQVTAG